MDHDTDIPMYQKTEAAIWSRYQMLDKLGEGVYGSVYKAYNKETGRIVAIKETCSDMQGVLTTTMRELGIMKLLSHPNVVAMLEASICEFNHQVFIVMEYCPTDLQLFIRDRFDDLKGLERV